jgi:dTMP kinase
VNSARGPGRFLTLEGIEGVGKTTQIERLSRLLDRHEIAHAVTREPGGTPLAEQIRALVLCAREEVVPDAAELLLVFAARSAHLKNLIEPNLAAGRWVLCDRFTDSTYAYQGGGRGLDERVIRMLEQLVQETRRPDLTLLIDVPVELGLARAAQRRAAAAGAGAGASGAVGAGAGPSGAVGAGAGMAAGAGMSAAGASEDRFDAQRADFFERVRAAYLARAAAEPERIALIDGRASPDEVGEAIANVLRAKAWIS